jgi:hypothetical protein
MFMGFEVLQNNPSGALIPVDAVHSCTGTEFCTSELGTPSHIPTCTVYVCIQESRVVGSFRAVQMCYIFNNLKHSNAMFSIVTDLLKSLLSNGSINTQRPNTQQ